MTAAQATKTFIEVQFPIGPLSLESYIERDAKGAKALSSLGKWWGSKPLVLTRAIILGTVFPASEDSERWPDDLAIFLRCMTLDNAGMWKRKTEARCLPKLCYPMATASGKGRTVPGFRALGARCRSRAKVGAGETVLLRYGLCRAARILLSRRADRRPSRRIVGGNQRLSRHHGSDTAGTDRATFHSPLRQAAQGGRCVFRHGVDSV